jgi:hypothetical protein
LIDGGYQTKRLKAQTMEEEASYYEKDFNEYVFNSWEAFFDAEKSAYSRWSPQLERAVKDLGIEKNNQVIWPAKGKTARHIIEAMHKHETEDVYDSLPSNVLLLRATLPKSWDEYRGLTGEIFIQKANGLVK